MTNQPVTPQFSSLLRPLPIPSTQPECYISFKQALNLRYPSEDTGDWHFEPAFYERVDLPPRQHPIPLAGKGQTVDSTPSLGLLGVRDMAVVMAQQGLPVIPSQPVYVANHYRAIADLALMDLQEARRPGYATNQQINSWLDNVEQIQHLKLNYLQPLAVQLSGTALFLFKEWITTIEFS